jgi:hypothetical protein
MRKVSASQAPVSNAPPPEARPGSRVDSTVSESSLAIRLFPLQASIRALASLLRSTLHSLQAAGGAAAVLGLVTDRGNNCEGGAGYSARPPQPRGRGRAMAHIVVPSMTERS